jgi:hypothetical protein
MAGRKKPVDPIVRRVQQRLDCRRHQHVGH